MLKGLVRSAQVLLNLGSARTIRFSAIPLYTKADSFSLGRACFARSMRKDAKEKIKEKMIEKYGDDPYEEHRKNFENAKAALEKVFRPDMTPEEITFEVDKAFREHIPPAPPWHEIERIMEQKELQSRARRLELLRSRKKRLVLPSIDALGRVYATGKRKTAVARVWVMHGNGSVIVNKKHMVDYFPRLAHREEIFVPLEPCAQVTGKPTAYSVWCTVKGGGLTGQAGAVKLGVARALQGFGHRAELKKYKLLTFDERQVERKKPGRAKARRRFQWVKR